MKKLPDSTNLICRIALIAVSFLIFVTIGTIFKHDSYIDYLLNPGLNLKTLISYIIVLTFLILIIIDIYDYIYKFKTKQLNKKMVVSLILSIAIPLIVLILFLKIYDQKIERIYEQSELNQEKSQREQEELIDKKIEELNIRINDYNNPEDIKEAEEELERVIREGKEKGLLYKERFMTKEDLLRKIDDSLESLPEREYYMLKDGENLPDEEINKVKSENNYLLHELTKLREEVVNYKGRERDDMKYLYDKYDKIYKNLN